MTLPTSSDVPRVAEKLRATADWLDEHGARVLDARHARIPADRTGSGAGVSDPTGAAGAELVDDWLVKQQHQLRLHLAELHDNTADTMQLIHTVVSRMAPRRTDDDHEGRCRQERCGKKATRGGDCEACARWRDRHRHTDKSRPDRVDPTVIERRNARESSGRVHVTGPMADPDVTVSA